MNWQEIGFWILLGWFLCAGFHAFGAWVRDRAASDPADLVVLNGGDRDGN